MTTFWQNVSTYDWKHAGMHAAASMASVVAILIVAHVAVRVGAAVIDRLARRGRPGLSLLDEPRLITVVAVLKSVLRYTVDFLAAITMMAAVGVPIGGVLAGAGIAGLAIGFGAQSLVRDIITGFFLVLEDQFRVGETVSLAGVTGSVEEIGFRVTTVRDAGGQLYWIPNGKIDQVTNHSRGAMRMLVTVEVPYDENLERVEAVLTEACRRFRESGHAPTEGPTVLGLTRLAGGVAEFTVLGRTRNGEQWAAERALRMALKKALDEAGIGAPYPRVARAGAPPIAPPGARGSGQPAPPEGEFP